MIPKIVHQTWKTRDLPDRYRHWSRTFQTHLPDWEHRFWDDHDCLQLVREGYPRYLDAYLRLSNPAERADLFRYMVLCKYGGLYADIDCECLRPPDFIAPEDEFIVGIELDTSSRRVMSLYRSDLSRLYCQWTFLSRPRHPILEDLIARIAAGDDSAPTNDPIVRVLKRTGPHAFTRAVESCLSTGLHPVRILPAAFFGAAHTANTFTFAVSFLFPELFRKVYIRHHFEMSWMDRRTKRDMMLRNLFFLKPRKGPSA